MNEEERDGEEGSPRRPRVVDKRISARPPAEKSAAPESGPPTGNAAASAPQATGASLPASGTPSASETSPAPPEEPAPQPPASAAGASPGERVWTPEQEAEAARMAQEIAATPSFEWVVNTAVTLANVAATKLELGPGNDAQLAIDALAGLLNSVGSRLQQAESPLRQTLAQLQLAYAERLSAPPP
jgi:hypothetical protein